MPIRRCDINHRDAGGRAELGDVNDIARPSVGLQRQASQIRPVGDVAFQTARNASRCELARGRIEESRAQRIALRIDDIEQRLIGAEQNIAGINSITQAVAHSLFQFARGDIGNFDQRRGRSVAEDGIVAVLGHLHRSWIAGIARRNCARRILHVAVGYRRPGRNVE